MSKAFRQAKLEDQKPETLPFTVDSALLRELGERLVGRAHIALAELIKNSYDADASVVDVVFGKDSIVIRDDGHGMTYDEFRDFWMRIGSPHKERERSSRTLERPLTGSKGVGRLAAQFLAHAIELRSVSAESLDQEIVAEVDWDAAVSAGSLTVAEARVRIQEPDTSLPGASPHGTWMRLDRLKQEWGSEELADVARQLWPLQPPFDRSPTNGEGGEEDLDEQEYGDDPLDALLEEIDGEDERQGPSRAPGGFRVRLRTRDRGATQQFEQYMRQVLDLWSARITGTLDAPDRRGRVTGQLVVDVEFSDGHHDRFEEERTDQPLHGLEFEIRVFSLQHRQRHQIRVDDARDYLKRNGGVHVYDAGFHLPYYGVDTDWLGVERDHAHRLTLSKLLPKELNVERGLNALPTNTRLYGVVRIDTARERRDTPADRQIRDALTIQVSRDRLVDNDGLRELSRLVRTALDFYAVQETRRNQVRRAAAAEEPSPAKARRVGEVLERYHDEIPAPAYRALSNEIDGVLQTVQSEAEEQAAQASLLGTLATAGMSAIAFEHEFSRQLSELERLARALRRAKTMEKVASLAASLESAIAEARASRRLFSHLLDEDDREERRALRARPVLDATRDQLQHFIRGIEVDHSGVPGDLRLPVGTMAEWGSLFQNVYVNAINAMLDSDERRLAATADVRRRTHRILVQDTGNGVDLADAERLFEPFQRHQALSEERRQLGFGGTGLGLTIVRMLATNLSCTARFVEPDPGYTSAFELAWDNKN